MFSLSSLIYFYQVHADQIKDDESVMAFMKGAWEEVDHSYELMVDQLLSNEVLWGWI